MSGEGVPEDKGKKSLSLKYDSGEVPPQGEDSI